MKKFLVTILIVLTFFGSIISGTILQPASAHAEELLDAATKAFLNFFPGATVIQTGSEIITKITPNKNDETPPVGICIKFGLPFKISIDINECMAWVMQITLTIAGAILWLVGQYLDIVIQLSIVEMKKFVDGIGAINIGWTLVRDFINMIFIFALLWIAISTILGFGEGQMKKLLVNLIIAGLLINFSLFFTKALIDASNILTVELYKNVATSPDGKKSSISTIVMQSLHLPSIYGKAKDIRGVIGGTGGPIVAEKATGINFVEIYIIGALGTFFILATAFVLGATGILLSLRFVSLVMLMVLSPVAFLGMILPTLGKYSKMWWEKLWNNLIFAPLLMLLIVISLKIVSDPTFTTSLVQGAGSTAGAAGGGAGGFFKWVDAFLGFSGAVTIVYNFVIVIAFMLGSLYIAKKAGAEGADMATKFGGKLAFGTFGAVGRNTLGRGASTFLESKTGQKFKDFAAKDPTGLSRLALKGVKGTATSSFDVRNANQDFSKLAGLGKGVDAKKINYEAIQKTRREEGVKFSEEYLGAKDIGKLEKEKASLEKHKDELDKRDAGIRNQATKLVLESDPTLKGRFDVAENDVRAAEGAYFSARGRGAQAGELLALEAALNEKKRARDETRKEVDTLLHPYVEKLYTEKGLDKTKEDEAAKVIEAAIRATEAKLEPLEERRENYAKVVEGDIIRKGLAKIGGGIESVPVAGKVLTPISVYLKTPEQENRKIGDAIRKARGEKKKQDSKDLIEGLLKALGAEDIEVSEKKEEGGASGGGGGGSLGGGASGGADESKTT